MLLNLAVGQYVAAVNPYRWVRILPSVGSVTQPDGTRVPQYGAPIRARGQIQSLTFTDITQLNGINLTGERRAIYLNGDVQAIVRADRKGGDIIEFPHDRSVWLVAYLLENWMDTGGWVKVAVTRQSPNGFNPAAF